jgi:hypothetical protein
MKPVLAGIVLGIGASFGLSRLVAGFLLMFHQLTGSRSRWRPLYYASSQWRQIWHLRGGQRAWTRWWLCVTNSSRPKFVCGKLPGPFARGLPSGIVFTGVLLVHSCFGRIVRIPDKGGKSFARLEAFDE